MRARLDPHRIRRDLTGLAALHKPTPRATLLSIHPAPLGVVVRIRTPDGLTVEVNVLTADAPGLQTLCDLDRSKVRSALLLAHNGGRMDAA